jgi:hypothetical protein
MSEVSICNSALRAVGAERINSLAEDNKRAIVCAEQYPNTRKHLIRSGKWNFATKRVELASTVNTPSFEYTYEFQLPSDCLKVLRLEQEDVKYVIEGNKLLTNETSIKIKYISDVTDTDLFPSDFSEVLALKLACDICMQLTQDRLLKRDLLAELQVLLADARSMDAQEGTPDDLVNDVWLNSRY